MKNTTRILLAAGLSLPCAPTVLAQDLWINEFHYDNDGADTGEFVEIVIADRVATALADMELVLYNGSGGTVSGSHGLDSFTAGTATAGFSFYSKAISGIQNGSPDGLALVADGAVAQFLSYEGDFTATDGPASGMMSTDIGVAESGNTPVGQSLQLSGTGSVYADFTWQAPAAETPGDPNTGQTLQAAAPVLNEILVSTSGDDAEFFEIAGAGGTDLSAYHLLAVDDTGIIQLALALDGSIPADGFWTAASPVAETNYGITADQAIADNTFTNDPRTYLLVEAFTGMVGDDLDSNDDGSLDATPWNARVDGLAVIDDSAPLTYADVVIGPDGTFLAPGALRCPDPSGDWEMHAFSDALNDGTPGTANHCAAFVAPSVTATDPADGAMAVDVDTDLIVSFDQVINAQAGAVNLECDGDPVALSGLPANGTDTLTVTPGSALPAGVSCTATAVASLIENGNGENPAGDTVWTFQIAFGVLEIWEIQGDGAASPFAGQVVTTEGNVVTAVGPEGFFMQTPEGSSDNDIDTSDGIYVFTGPAPDVGVGDIVNVTGEVIEYFDFTEFSNDPTVTVATRGGRGTALPDPVVFDDTVPSPDPDAPSCAIELECYEGMRVEIPRGRVGSGNEAFASEPFAEVYVTAGGDRAFREPGVVEPGPGGGIPTWDGNPEVFQLSTAALGLPAMALYAGSTFSATGALGFSFGDYELWPTDFTLDNEPVLPRPVPAAGVASVSVGTLNLLRLFNDVDDPGISEPVTDPAEYAARLNRFATHIAESMDAPAVVAVQEIENLDTLDDLAAEITAVDASLSYSAELAEGNDVGGIDVGYLVRDDVSILAVDQLGESETLSVDGSLLHDRPPLLLQAEFSDGGDTLAMNLLVVHMRSLNGIDGGDSNATRVKTKRLEQAQSLARMVQDLQTTEPDIPVVALGDFNAFQFTDGYIDLLGQVAGTAVDAENEFWDTPITSPTLAVSTLNLPAEERYSYVFEGNAQALDHALYSQSAVPHFLDANYTRGNADAPEEYYENPPAGEQDLGVSDHDSLVLTFAIVAEMIFADGFED